LWCVTATAATQGVTALQGGATRITSFISPSGPTRLDNLVLGCTRHHHQWHDQGCQLTLARDGTLTLVSPNGLVLTSSPSKNVLVGSTMF